jgi:serine/threonine protein kinase
VNLKLIDFGFSCKLEEGEKAKEQLGTIDYMCPEMIKGEAYDEKIDIWSVGVVLFNMVSGRQAFTGDNDDQVMKEILEKEPHFEFIDM